jgi:hypothetical protein
MELFIYFINSKLIIDMTNTIKPIYRVIRNVFITFMSGRQNWDLMSMNFSKDYPKD